MSDFAQKLRSIQFGKARTPTRWTERDTAGRKVEVRRDDLGNDTRLHHAGDRQDIVIHAPAVAITTAVNEVR